jgi:hypothetical protein
MVARRKKIVISFNLGKPIDQKEETKMILTNYDSLADRMIHRDFPGGFEELEENMLEVCEGSRIIAFATRTIPTTCAGNTPTISDYFVRNLWQYQGPICIIRKVIFSLTRFHHTAL